MAAGNYHKRNYAIEDDTDKVVNIFSLSRELCTGHKYYCPDCRNEMYPTFGEKYVHHFRHLGNVCQKNNYLHATAEFLFLEEYQKCLENGEPFLLEVHSHVSCDRHCTERRNRVCTSHKNSTLVDLTKIYTSVKREHRVQVEEHFRRPDILLTAENGEQLWIEIWVTHETGADKRKDGHIIELKIISEKDLEQITNHKLIKTTDNELAVRLFNVKFEEQGIISKISYISEECSDFKAIRNPLASYKRPIPKPAKSPVVHDVPTAVVDDASIEWIDLGLPSGTLWAPSNYASRVSFDSAYQGYHKHLPATTDATELKTCCTRAWCAKSKTMTFTGPNGNTLSFHIPDKHASFWLNRYEEWRDLGQCFHLCQDNSFYINDMPSSNPGNIRFVKRVANKRETQTESTLFDETNN